MNAKEILVAARKRIEKKENWFGGDNQLNDIERQTCAGIALGCTSYDCEPAAAVLARVINGSSTESFEDSARIIVDYNNSHTHAEVLATFDRAIELAEHLQ